MYAAYILAFLALASLVAAADLYKALDRAWVVLTC